MTSVTNERYARGLASNRLVRNGVQRVLVVDDSHAIQRLVKHALDSDPRLEVVGVADDAYAARDMIKRLEPDVLVLDVEMPRMSGLDFLARVMRLRPMPVVMFSSVTQLGSDAAVRALVLGAIDCVAKPTEGVTPEVLAELADRVHAAATAPVLLSSPKRGEAVTPAGTGSEGAAAAGSAARRGEVILIGASTGGVAAVEVVLRGLPRSAPPVVISQHMPQSFLTSFSARLNSVLSQTVLQAEDGLELRPGHIYLAPGGEEHTGVARRGGRLVCTAINRPKRNGHCPSVDELFFSAVDLADKVTAVILTGLGRDGAEGMRALHDSGAHCIGQDEASCIVYGMPRAAAAAGALDEQLPLGDISTAIMRSKDRAMDRAR